MKFFKNNNIAFIVKSALFCLFLAANGPLAAQFVSPNIVTTNSLSTFVDLLKTADKKTFVASDVDDVLMTGQDPATQGSLRNKLLLKQYGWRLWELAWGADYLSAYLWQTCKVKAVDGENMAQALKIMQDKDIPFIGLTAGFSGDIKEVKNFHQTRIGLLKNVGVDINWGVGKLDPIAFNSLKPYAKNYPARLDSGVIFCSNIPKPRVLEEFFKTPEFAEMPNHVIFIDDSLSNVKAMEKYWQEHWKDKGMQFTGIHFTCVDDQHKEADKKDKNRAALNLAVGAYQFKHLAKNKKWIDRDQAELNMAEEETSFFNSSPLFL